MGSKGRKAMRCINCSGQIVTINGDLELQDKILGEFTVQDTEFDQCEDCGEKLYSPITLKAIEETEAKRKKELLLEKPLNSFITAAEVAKILGCTRQAVHKHKRIRRGFIHFVKHNGILQYLKESVELFKETGDGRLPLVEPKKKTKSNIIGRKRSPFPEISPTFCAT
jgi:hypothetical protein